MERVCYIFKPQHNFPLKMINIYYSLDSVFNIYWTKCLYLQLILSKTQHLCAFHYMSKYLFISIPFCPTTSGLSDTSGNSGTSGTSWKLLTVYDGWWWGLTHKIIRLWLEKGNPMRFIEGPLPLKRQDKKSIFIKCL
jgi:hypothetical protein